MSTVARHLSIVLLFFGYAGTVHATQKADLVKVDKGESRLDLIREGEVFASFGVVFGASPRGHKQQQGDERTPEGRYVLDYKNAASSYYKSIHVSYPNAGDRETRKRGVDPGGEIMIHGQPNGWEWLAPISQLFNWTEGCIALRNPVELGIRLDPGLPRLLRPTPSPTGRHAVGPTAGC